MELLLGALHKFLCFLGFHHYHDINEAGTPIRGPEGMKIKGRFCCRCHDLQIDEIEMDGKKSKPAKVKRVG